MRRHHTDDVLSLAVSKLPGFGESADLDLPPEFVVELPDMKKFAPVLLLAIAGCTTVAPSQGYRPPGSTAAPWQIRGELFDFTNVKIYIDGTKVIDDRVSLISGDGEFHSTYQGKPVSASCHTSAGLVNINTHCIVFVQNERAATLTF
jgi:hypothetical protein